MNFISWLSVFGVCCLGAISPGPSLAVVIRHTIRGSRRDGMITGVAHSCGVGLYALLTVSGLAAVLAMQPALHRFLTVCGGLYLAWLGIKALRSRAAGIVGGATEQSDHHGSPSASEVNVGEAIRDGFMMSLLNPKLMIFFLALFSQFVTPHMTWCVSLIMVATALCVDATWYCLVAIVLSRGPLIEKINRHALQIDRITGILFLLIACRVVTL